jgi:hypothetical protein
MLVLLDALSHMLYLSLQAAILPFIILSYVTSIKLFKKPTFAFNVDVHVSRFIYE